MWAIDGGSMNNFFQKSVTRYPESSVTILKGVFNE
jgi:hypothetical protein